MTANELYADTAVQSRSYSYCLGFVEATDHGQQLSYDKFVSDKHKLLYKIGYEAGITEYCNANYPEE